MARLRSIFSILLSSFVNVLLFSLLAHAQQDPAISRGLKPYGTYNGGDIDVVSVDSWKLDLHAPLLSYPQRGALSMNFTIRYVNPSFEVDKDCEPGFPTPPCDFLTSASVLGVYVSPDFLQVGVDGRGYTDATGKVIGNVFSVTTPDGGEHELGATTSTLFESVDATGFKWDKTANVVTDKDGIRYTIATGALNANAVEDTNGNKITTVAGGYEDTLGRTIPLLPGLFGASGGTISRCPTGGLTVFEAFDWNVPGPTGTTQTYTFCYIQKALNVNLHTPIGPHSIGDTHSPTLLQSIVLPNGQYWNFTYGDQYDNLTQITLPTGGTISYGAGPGQMCTLGGSTFPQTFFSQIGTRSVNANDGTGTHTWTYSGTTATTAGSTTSPLLHTVTDPLGNQDVMTMTPLSNTCSYFETQKQSYQGSSATGTLLETTSTTYSYTLNVDDNSARKSVVNVVPTQIATLWPNGKAKATFNTYDSGFAYTGPGGSSTGIYGSLLTKSEFDYGIGVGTGALLKKTTTNYLAFSNPSYLNLNLLNLVSSEVVADGSGTQKESTSYGYDQLSLSSSGVTIQHDLSPPTGLTRGNQTTISRWLNTTGTFLTANRAFYDTGMVNTSTDPLTHTTTYSYSSSFNGAYLTQTQLPITGTVQHITSSNYDFNTGLVLSTTDQNSNTTGYTYDNMWRIKTITPPLAVGVEIAGVTTFNYNDTVGSLSVEKSLQVDSTRSTDEFVYFDGLGRQISQATANDESVAWDKTDTCYDARGLKSFESYPYQTTVPSAAPTCTGAGDSYAYDAVTRPTSITHSDSSSITTSYTGQATSVLDEGNGTQRVQHVSQVDGLGRTVAVCEVTSTTMVGLSGTPAACNLDIPSTGFLTTYQYDTLNNLIGVTQGGLNPRTFVYDSLSRLTSDTNPETGATTYSYDANSNVLQRVRLKPNVTDGTTVTTTYAYDALNRLLQTSYDDGMTPTAYNYYDESAIYGVTLQNTVGRLSRSLVNTSSFSYDLLSYDAVGRVVINWQDTPDFAGNSKQLSYGYDLAGDLISASNGVGWTTFYTYNRATRLSGATSNLSDSSHPGTLASAIHYNAFGASVSSSFGNGAAETRTYDGRGRLTQVVDNGNTITPAVAGSATIPLTFNEQSNGTAGTGTVNVSGSEQNVVKNIPASGSVAISGTEQSKQVQTAAAQAGHATFTINGAPETTVFNPCPPQHSCPMTEVNSGNIAVTINGVQLAAGYGTTTDTPSSMASQLASNINLNSSSPVTASASGATVTVTAKTTGAATNYGVSTSSTWNTGFFTGSSFSITASALTGGQDATFGTSFDTGNVSIAVNGYSKSESYSQTSTNLSLASALASDFTNDPSSPVTASVSGGTISFTTRSSGSTTNYSLSCSSGTTNGNFSSSSFGCSPSGATLTGGTTTTIYDSGTAKITVNGGIATASYGQGSTASTIAQSLTTSLNGLTATTNVTASVSGTTISLHSNTSGSTTNYLLSTTITYDSTDFSSASFSEAPSGATLTGGSDPFGGGALFDSGTVTLTVSTAPPLTSSATYGQGDTADTLATKLVQNFPANSSVAVTKSGTGTIQIAALQTGASTNYSYSFAQTHSASFGSPSFGGPLSGALSGGLNTGTNPTTVYTFNLGLAPDGVLLTGNDSINGNWTYTYDPLNRLVSSSKTGQAFTYAYDRYGNRLQQNVTAGSGPAPQYSFDANNRIATGSSVTYDQAGNVTNDGTHTYAYDGENRIVKVDGGGTAVYAYDAAGRRIWKSSGGVATDYLYDLSGHRITNVQGSVWVEGEVFAAGRHLSTYVNGTTYFPMSDWLGTERSRTDLNAANCETILSLPYGDAMTTSGPCGDPSTMHFTGKDRDGETGLDDFPARYYSSVQGRWYTPDWSPVPVAIPYADLGNPQTLNLYDYVGGDPTNHADADGHLQEGVGANPDDARRKHAFGADDGKDQDVSVREVMTIKKIVHAGLSLEDWADNIFDRLMNGGNALAPGGRAEIRAFCAASPAPNMCAELWSRARPLDGLRLWMTAAVPPLRVIHSKESPTYKDWSKASTQDIVDSLAPGSESPLTVKTDGSIMQGNTRITVLKERGFDVDSLPRVEYQPWPMPELGEPIE